LTDHSVVSREEWAAAREELLAREKEHTRLGDELARQRRELPWVQVEREYRLETGDGYRAGCPVNSSIADAFDGLVPHLKARDATMICVSGAPLEKLLAYRERMGDHWSRG
jgi:predicted dithiol-disulfide oxidoreductase (DUF899 family)